MNHRALALEDRTPAPPRRIGWKILAVLVGAGTLFWMLTPRGPSPQDDHQRDDDDDVPADPSASQPPHTDGNESRDAERLRRG